jgi:hypothetical protein
LRSALVSVIAAAVGLPAAAIALPYLETFDGPDGASWPAPWTAVTPHVLVQDLQGDRARLGGDASHVARMALPGFAATDVEAEVTVEFEDVALQGFGFYVRQNGGYLQDTVPHGQGYAMFLKGNWAWPEDLGLWHELDGVEIQFTTAFNPVPGGLQDGVPYRLRFRVTQSDASTTLLQAKVWEAAGAEPAGWTVQANGTAPVLQGTAGSFAVDIYNHAGTANLFVDDLVIRSYPYPVGAPAVASAVTPLQASPHPVRDHAVLRLSLPERVPAVLRVHDAAGRRLDSRPLGDVGPGPVSLPWSAVRAGGAPLASGVYFVEILTAGRSFTRKVVVRR